VTGQRHSGKAETDALPESDRQNKVWIQLAYLERKRITGFVGILKPHEYMTRIGEVIKIRLKPVEDSRMFH